MYQEEKSLKLLEFSDQAVVVAAVVTLSLYLRLTIPTELTPVNGHASGTSCLLDATWLSCAILTNPVASYSQIHSLCSHLPDGIFLRAFGFGAPPKQRLNCGKSNLLFSFH